MEQANNTFSHGLQMDTHPMVQGTDSLTDCLNGTLITMNGNEVILQNDMGNRRVDNAFLPAGYEPVGMKEYGGIIYVAAYNPITNKSQIGSFPSPQKKQDTKDIKPTEISFDIESYNETIGNQSFNFLKSDFKLYSLTNDTSLRTGDKFVVYASGLEGKKDKITNYDNVKNEKIKSPKNKKYTLQIGILNSQNEFIDITKTLCRWHHNVGENNWKIIENNENYSEEYKFNQGYFIPDSFTPPSTETISDANLIKSRQLLETNTYSYKLVGPMYLKVIYNHISRFNYNIYGTKNGSELTLWVEGYITYNCPDGVTNPEPANNNDTYYTLDEGTPNFKGFELYSLTNGINLTIDPEYSEKGVSVYDENSNTYSVKIVKKYKCDNIDNNTKLDYFIGVYYNDSVFLKDLSEKGSLNISLLGSGELSVENWRFFNDLDQKKTILTFSLNVYPKYGESFENIKFIFSNYTTYCNIKNQNESFEVPTFEVLNIQPYNGRQTIEIDWGEKVISPRAVYNLQKIFYYTNDGSLSPEQTIQFNPKTSTTIYWILTTNLFNEFYNTINNFCTTTDESFINKMNVKLKINKSFKVNQDDNEQEEKIGGLELSTTDSKEITYKIKHIHSVSINNNSTLEIDENYPVNFWIKEEEKRKFKLIKRYKFNNDESFVPDNLNKYFNEHLLTFSKGSGSNNSQFNSKTVFIEDLTGNGEDNILKGAINNYDIFIGTCDQQFKGTLENVFDKFSNVIDKVSPNADMGFENSKYKNYYAGIAPYSQTGSGSEGHGYLHIITGYPYYKEPSGGLEKDKDYVRYGEYDDRGYPVAVYQDSIFNYFNETSKPSSGTTKSSIYKSFTYFYSPDITTATRLPGHDPNLSDRLINSCKVWWKCSDSTWALFPQQFVFTDRAPSILTQFKNYLMNHLRYDYIYCIYNTYDMNNTSIKLYRANKNYTYSKPYSHTIHLYLGLESSKNISEIVGKNFEEIGNLNFKLETNKVKIDAEEIASYNITSNSSLETEVQAYVNATSFKNIGLIKEGDNIIYVIKDTKGRLLDPNYVYSFNKDGTLTRLDDESKLLAVQEQLDFNLLLYNGWRRGSPIIPFEFDWGTAAFLTFGDLKLVDGV